MARVFSGEFFIKCFYLKIKKEIFSDTDIEIRFIFRDILNAILTKLEESILGQPISNQKKTETNFSASIMQQFVVTDQLTVGDPAYRLLRLILLSTDFQRFDSQTLTRMFMIRLCCYVS